MAQRDMIEIETVLHTLSHMTHDEYRGLMLGYVTAWPHEVPIIIERFKRLVATSPPNPAHSARSNHRI